MPRLTLRTRLRQRRDCAFQTLDGETVVLIPRKRTVHQLNEVGSFLWAELARPASLARLVERVCEEFEVDETNARADVLAFVRELIDLELVLVHEPRPRRSSAERGA